jgi:putative ABC transport system substrate-binding protein
MSNRREFIALIGGVAAVWPRAMHAQPKSMSAIGYLHNGTPGPAASNVDAFRRGLSETGYIEGKNLQIEYRWAEGNYDRLPELAADLVRRKVEVIATGGGPPAALAAKNATSTIPIVFVVGTDPVELGLVASLARPGGHLTGAAMLLTELEAKRLELLSELVPQAKVIALLVNPNYSGAGKMTLEVGEAARAKGFQFHVVRARTVREIDDAFSSVAQLKADALVVGNDTFLSDRREQIVALASRNAIPATYMAREFVLVGGLMSYGPNIASAYQQAGAYVGRILAGVKPGDLPVQQPVKFDLVINLKTAKTLGLTVPQTLQIAADRVIE